ncbi:AAA family ATPase [Mesorhizobium sp.]|uniref:AAA family ATPase n=1 Tax=Mesorhizobium sp. TaxID=1871066 RepID=UPI0025BF4439|nr:AAA family ATPase [Mesorhizobium sp.]
MGETRKGKPVYSNPDYNIGLDTEKSGVICIDCDEKDGKHGIAALRNLAAEQGVELGPDADVFMTRSASGGVHAYFEGEPVQSKNSVLADGVDVKSRKALAVLPGSTIGGKLYTPVGGKPRKPDKLPQWLVDAIAQKWTKATPVTLMIAVPGDDPADITAVKARLETEQQSVSGNGGNANLIRVIRTLWDAGITADTAVELLGPWNARNTPPWDEGELEYKVHSAYQNTENAFGCRSLAHEFDELPDDTAPLAEAAALAEVRLLKDIDASDADILALIRKHAANGGTRIAEEARQADGGYECLSPDELEADTGLDREPIVEDTLARGDFMCIFGMPGSGKSLLAPYIALRISQGEDIFGKKTMPMPALYAAAEDPRGMRARLKALRKRYGRHNVHLATGIANLRKGSLDFKRVVDDLKRTGAGVLVIDTSNMAFPGIRENDDGDDGMGRVVTACKAICRLGIAVILIHHNDKADGDTPRGHGCLHGATDVEVKTSKNASGVSTCRLKKNRNGFDNIVLATFAVGVEPAGVNPWGKPQTVAYLKETDTPADPDEEFDRLDHMTAYEKRAILDAIASGYDRRHHKAEKYVPKAPGLLTALGHDADTSKTRKTVIDLCDELSAVGILRRGEKLVKGDKQEFFAIDPAKREDWLAE